MTEGIVLKRRSSPAPVRKMVWECFRKPDSSDTLIVDIESCPVTLDIEGLLVDIVEARGGTRPAENPIGVFGLHVHAAMAHRDSEIIMPVSAVQGNAFACKKTAPGNSGQDDVVSQAAGGGVHASRREFVQYI